MEDKYLWEVSNKLIEFNTVSFKSNSPCVSYIAQELESLGFDVFIEQYDDNGVLKEQIIASAGPAKADGLILSGHIDTVPFEKQIGWTKDPLKLTLEDEKLFGRGTTDMKLFIAHCLSAFKEIDLNKLTKPIVCIFTADEEIGCLGSKRLIKKVDSILKKMPLPKKAIIGEPTSFNIVNTHKGIVHFELILKGKAGHSSRPDLGSNSIEDLGLVIELVKEMNADYQKQLDSEVQKIFPDFPYNHLHMALINGGEALNMIPDEIILGISYRCFPMDRPLKVYDELKKNLEKLPTAYKVETRNLFSTPGLEAGKDQKFTSLLNEITKSTIQSVSFATDAGYLSQADIECYVCGPGTIEMAHQPNEYMSLNDFMQGKEFVKSLVQKFLLT